LKSYLKLNNYKAPTVNFQELVKNNQTTLSLTCQSKMIDLLNTEFTEKQSKWLITTQLQIILLTWRMFIK
jgi:hypothetical protein